MINANALSKWTLAGITAATLMACGGSNEPSSNTETQAAAPAKPETIEWKMVTTWPKNYPGLGAGANRFAKRVEEMSAGRIKIKVYGAKELVPAFEVFDAVRQGSAGMGHGAAYYWKGKIQPGVSDAMVSQLDIFSSLAQLVGSEVRTNDSQPLLDLFLGQSDVGRNEMVLEATSRTAFKKGDWVMIPPYKGPAVNKNVQIELGNNSDFQLYNLAEDVGQQNNLAEQQPEKLQEMLTAFESIRGKGYGKTEKLELK